MALPATRLPRLVALQRSWSACAIDSSASRAPPRGVGGCKSGTAGAAVVEVAAAVTPAGDARGRFARLAKADDARGCLRDVVWLLVEDFRACADAVAGVWLEVASAAAAGGAGAGAGAGAELAGEAPDAGGGDRAAMGARAPRSLQLRPPCARCAAVARQERSGEPRGGFRDDRIEKAAATRPPRSLRRTNTIHSASARVRSELCLSYPAASDPSAGRPTGNMRSSDRQLTDRNLTHSQCLQGS